MENLWKNNNDGSYSFLVNGEHCGTLQASASNKFATITIGNRTFKILRKGFFKSHIVILDERDTELLSARPLKWYASSYGMDYNDKSYVLKIGNNPLAEWAIYQDTKLQLAYALNSFNGKPGLKISGLSDAPLLFNFLLWYLIKPIIIENTGQDSDFLLLITAASS